MFLSIEHIMGALDQLKSVNPFYGITFMVCKKGGLPIGSTGIDFPMNKLTRHHMELHHKIDATSDRFYQPFSQKKKQWVVNKYPSAGLQAINTQTFGTAFQHQRNTQLWSWADDYLSVLAAELSTNKIPLFAMCVWLYRSADFDRFDNLVDTFIEEYHITPEERDLLFDSTPPSYSTFPLQQHAAPSIELLAILGRPPDAPPEGGGRLAYLRVKGAGAMPSVAVEPAERLTLIAGDNGLGKTFLLDCAWWALTGSWASIPAVPREDSGRKDVSIEFGVRGAGRHVPQQLVRYDWKRLNWQEHPGSSTVAGLVVYACVDGSYAIWDPTTQTTASVYSKDEVWNGVTAGDGRRIEGLVRDWRNWRSAEDNSTFETFRTVLEHLSPSDLGVLSPGPMTRVPRDPREIPTIEHRYGRVPILHTSAAVKRVLSLAYLIVWTWTEHHVHCHMAKRNPERRMVILVDEIEAHLHPRWQRQLLPALVSVVHLLSKNIDAQLIVSTHSPLVLASSETMFNGTKDLLLHLQLNNDKIALRKVNFMKFGKVDRWLMSDVFELIHARSKVAEDAIEDAKRTQRQESLPTKKDVRAVSDRLRVSLPDDDEFWPRWVEFADRFGVEL